MRGVVFWGVIAAIGSAAQPAAAADDLAVHRWKSRVLVVIAPNGDHPNLLRQTRIFDSMRETRTQRDLVLHAESGASATADTLRKRFGVPRGEFRAFLVGKDGEAKLSSSEPITAARLVETIDAMPMRRDEMRRGREGGS